MKSELMKELINKYEQLDHMKDNEMKLVVETYVAKLEHKLVSLLSGEFNDKV